MTRKRAILWSSTGVVLVAVVVVAAALFQPWRLFTNTTVDDALPPGETTSTSTATAEPAASAPTETPAPAASADPVYTDLARGSFITHEHETSGSVRLVQQPDGSRVLAIAGLDTSDGPDLRVWLSDQPVIEGVDGWHVFDDGRYLELGALKGNLGDQVYEIPADADLAGFQSVSIWCARFAVSFGAATLAPI
ncbi:hypothetical protein DEA06_10305 [Microbacterium sp. Gd 4-13]|uniref:DM13 domain-containing protein n=1 Tax=Microbacterium sp. Gd 4-13 TaxID=2173179 RepID=UPI000D575912|nr:DM13 domain-containing protein [Microbacterium sp. Gd 4-13]PVW04386.1 hypothetical protein DEA06_10305 [Microbacterium sp. Gd 4-13]